MDFLTRPRSLVQSVAFAAALCLCSFGFDAHAGRPGPGVAPSGYTTSSRVTLEDAAGRVRRSHGGRVVSASAAPREGRPGYRIRILKNDGRVQTFWVDAVTGKQRPSG